MPELLFVVNWVLKYVVLCRYMHKQYSQLGISFFLNTFLGHISLKYICRCKY